MPTDLTAASRQFLQKGDPLFVDDKTEKQLATEPDVLPDLQLSFDKPLVELFTSGSTGTPTRIEKTLKQILANIETLDRDFPDWAKEGSTICATVSHQHIYGFLWTILWPLATGKLITSERLLFPENILSALKKHDKCTTSHPLNKPPICFI